MIYFSRPRRCELLGSYIAQQGATVREAAQYFGISKSTVHKDVTVDLLRVDLALYKRVEAVLQKNKDERHLRGGEATRKKYKEKRLGALAQTADDTSQKEEK